MTRTEQFPRDVRSQIEDGGEFRIVDELYGYSLRPGRQARRRATAIGIASAAATSGTICRASSGTKTATIGITTVASTARARRATWAG